LDQYVIMPDYLYCINIIKRAASQPPLLKKMGCVPN
jgi:hypothetical protein